MPSQMPLKEPYKELYHYLPTHARNCWFYAFKNYIEASSDCNRHPVSRLNYHPSIACAHNVFGSKKFGPLRGETWHFKRKLLTKTQSHFFTVGFSSWGDLRPFICIKAAKVVKYGDNVLYNVWWCMLWDLVSVLILL